ncbi:response regulator transcription factor [Tissierella praeacuta]|uniref:response regulator transcription factor n=1 Tax=Tissierella praeacuta TaxID=43131 RepID=UPI001C11542A|nr:response regulator [Tissierella praeacuta]MBU5255871.1 response regulator [Tissierella praeacuta]
MYTVLIADDEIIERNYLKSVLKKHSEEFTLVGEATNGEQVVDMAFQKKPNIIIMDINMPLQNGLIAAKTIKEKFHNTIIILNSAYSEFEFAQQAIHYNLDAYLLKPASEKEILDTMINSLHKKYVKDQVIGDYNNISNTLNNKYPYALVDRLTNSIFTGDFELIRFNVLNYIDFLNSQQNNLEEYRLHIINTIFSIMRSLKKVLPDNIQLLLNGDEYLQKISKSQYWYDILAVTEDFFRQFLILFNAKLSLSSNFTDMVEKYIEENFEKQISLDMLGEIFHFNPSYLSRKFCEDKGYTINDFLNKKRIEHAIYLLKNSNLLIKDISRNCGFTNVSHFNRNFKKVTGKQPSQIRLEENIKNGY